jgi:RNA polymerase sigma-70 factor (ECF subfamily)
MNLPSLLVRADARKGFAVSHPAALTWVARVVVVRAGIFSDRRRYPASRLRRHSRCYNERLFNEFRTMGAPATSPLPDLEQREELARVHRGIQARDAESVARLYEETSGILYGLGIRILQDPKDAEEVVLAVCRQVWKSASEIDATHGGVLQSLTALPGAAPAIACDAPAERVHRGALQALAPEQRQAVEVAFFTGLTNAELANTLGAPVGTIKERIRAGMGKLRGALRPVANLESDV